jgi:sec-independent protein translocase protein TatA
MCVTTHPDAGRHERSDLSIDIDNERVRVLFQRTEIFLSITSSGFLLQTICRLRSRGRSFAKRNRGRVELFLRPYRSMHLLLIFGIALLVFGPKKLPELGKGIGEGIRGFKSAIKEKEKPSDTKTIVAGDQS